MCGFACDTCSVLALVVGAKKKPAEKRGCITRIRQAPTEKPPPVGSQRVSVDCRVLSGRLSIREWILLSHVGRTETRRIVTRESFFFILRESRKNPPVGLIKNKKVLSVMYFPRWHLWWKWADPAEMCDEQMTLESSELSWWHVTFAEYIAITCTRDLRYNSTAIKIKLCYSYKAIKLYSKCRLLRSADKFSAVFVLANYIAKKYNNKWN